MVAQLDTEDAEIKDFSPENQSPLKVFLSVEPDVDLFE